MKVVATFAEARSLARGRTGLVPTMGFFHEGHVALMRRSRTECDTVIVSLFVNPFQFGPDEDLDRYPRDFARDTSLAEAEGVDVLFAPPPDEMYPVQPSVRLTIEALAVVLEGRARPGHFEGVALVVAKLFAALQPDVAYMGRKDAQQLAVVRRLVRDLSFPIEIVGVSTVREQDGLALSSRNTYLTPDERSAALVLSRSLLVAARAVVAGERNGETLEGVVAEAVAAEPLVELGYARLVDAFDLVGLPTLDREAFLAAAATVGSTRLIDNLYFDGPDLTPDTGVLLDRPSILYAERAQTAVRDGGGECPQSER